MSMCCEERRFKLVKQVYCRVMYGRPFCFFFESCDFFPVLHICDII